VVLVCGDHCHLVSAYLLPPFDVVPQGEVQGRWSADRENRIASGGVGTFGSLIVRDFGYTNFDAILFNIPFGAIQFCMIIGSAWAATHWQRKGLTIAAVSVLPVVGVILMLTVPRTPGNKGVLLFGYYLVSRGHDFSFSEHRLMIS